MSQTRSQGHIVQFTVHIEDKKYIPASKVQGRQWLQLTPSLLFLKDTVRKHCGRRGKNTWFF